LLATLRGGCLAPVGAWGRVQDGQLQFDAAVLDPRGTRRLAVSQAGRPQEAAAVGEQAARELLQQGAGALIAAARDQA
jgi:hydroxymethylbilane synthase